MFNRGDDWRGVKVWKSFKRKHGNNYKGKSERERSKSEGERERAREREREKLLTVL